MNCIGTRHGEKLYEVLVTKEEMVNAIDMGDYYRIPADNRNLNYQKYTNEGNADLNDIEEYNLKSTVHSILFALTGACSIASEFNYLYQFGNTNEFMSKILTIMLASVSFTHGANVISNLLKSYNTAELRRKYVDSEINLINEEIKRKKI